MPSFQANHDQRLRFDDVGQGRTRIRNVLHHPGLPVLHLSYCVPQFSRLLTTLRKQSAAGPFDLNQCVTPIAALNHVVGYVLCPQSNLGSDGYCVIGEEHRMLGEILLNLFFSWRLF
jgi:hypothetical protein